MRSMRRSLVRSWRWPVGSREMVHYTCDRCGAAEQVERIPRNNGPKGWVMWHWQRSAEHPPVRAIPGNDNVYVTLCPSCDLGMWKALDPPPHAVLYEDEP